jgi:ADP-ribosylglycohydrolase
MRPKDRIYGSLVGLAVGDALGRPLEGMTAEEIKTYCGAVDHYIETPRPRKDKWSIPGLHSDDTQQALALAETILETGRADPDVLGRKFLALAGGPKALPLGAHRGFGRSFHFTVSSWKNGCRWNGGGRNSAGIGAAMRVGPVGLAFGGDDGFVRENAVLQALVTHNDPRGLASAATVAYLVGRALWTPAGGLDANKLLADALGFAGRTEGWIQDVHHRHLAPESADMARQFSKALGELTGHIENPPSTVLPMIQSNCEAISGYALKHPCQGFALGGVVAAIYFFLHDPGSFEGPVLEAVRSGGDADSVAAIVGSIAGALHGYGRIPEPWKRDLVGREQIELRAAALARESFDRDAWRDLPVVELEWTLMEEARRREGLGIPALTEAELADLEEIVIRPIVREPREDDEGRRSYGDRRDGARRGRERGRREGSRWDRFPTQPPTV